MFADLEVALKELREVDLSSLTAAEKDEAVLAVARLRTQLEAFEAALLSSWDSEKTWANDCSRTPAAWLARHSRTDLADCASRMRLAKTLRHMPLVAVAHAAGDIDTSHVRRIARAYNPRTREAFARDESVFIRWAQTKDFFRFSDRMARWSMRNDPDGASKSDMERRNRRDAYLVCSLDGMYLGKLTLDPLSGVIVSDEHARLEAQLFDADWREARERLGRTPLPTDLRRSPAQRRADAFVEMARRSSRPSAGKAARPLFTMLLGGKDNFAGLCALSDGQNLSPEVLRDFLAEADLQSILFDGNEIAIRASRKRFFGGIVRQIIEARDRFCSCGCGMPAHRCQMDHVIPYAEGGMTCQCNGEPRCRPTNRRKGRRGPPLP